jgi:hypothetical protein
MSTTLTLRPISGTENFQQGDHVYQYEVNGLPPGERFLVGEDVASRRWQILRTKDVVHGDWTGGYKSAEDALEAIQKEFEK